LGAALVGFIPGIKAIVFCSLILLITYYWKNSLVFLLVAILVGSCVISIRQFALNNQLLISYFNTQVEVEGVIQTDPIAKEGNVVGSNKLNSQYSALFKLTKIGQIKVDLPTRLKFDLSQRLAIDQTIRTQVRLVESKERKVAALLISSADIEVISNSRKIFTATTSIRESFKSLVKPTDAGSLIPGLVLGDISLQRSAFIEEMRRVGLSHLTAVSGANFALVATFLLWFLKYFIKRLRLRLYLVFLILLIFIFLVRPTPSVLRAAVMTAVILIARVLGDKSFGIPSLGCAISLLVLVDPFQSIDPGFALSVLATAGILLLPPFLNTKLERYIKIPWILDSIVIPVSATIFCFPVIILLSNQFSLATIPANILVAPVIAPITVLGFIAAILSPSAGLISTFIISIVTPLASWIVWVCEQMNKFSVITFNQSRIFSVLFLFSAILIIVKKRIIVLFILMLLLLQLFIGSLAWPGSGWQIANCDVGQGDGMVVNLGSASGIVIDTGPDLIKMDRCLHQLKIKKIPLLVLTHFHADHVGGVSSVIKGRDIGEVWISNNFQPQQAYESAIKLLKGMKVKTVKAGDNYLFPANDLKIKVLWPQPTKGGFKSLPGDGSEINNSSIALLIKTRQLSLFTAGDIEPPVQEIISNSGELVPVDVLKVSHHGSSYQHLPMLDLLKPKVALISVGAGNKYGHPSLDLITQLQRRQISVWRTDQSGGLALAAPNKIRVTGKEWWQIRWG
jgi:competence protein ComEC